MAVNGYFIGNYEVSGQINDRIYERYFPTNLDVFAPQYDPRPESTKYAPLFETPINVPPPRPNFTVELDFNPNYRAPLSGYSIDKETILQNRVFALQKGIEQEQSVYVPSSQSELYNIRVPTPVFGSAVFRPETENDIFRHLNSVPHTINERQFKVQPSTDYFNNFTRYQL